MKFEGSAPEAAVAFDPGGVAARRVGSAPFLTDDEKRGAVAYGPR